MSEGPLHILLVEDNPSDADLLQETLAQVDERLEDHARRTFAASRGIHQAGRES